MLDQYHRTIKYKFFIVQKNCQITENKVYLKKLFDILTSFSALSNFQQIKKVKSVRNR